MRRAVMLLALLGACAEGVSFGPPLVTLPADRVVGAGDPSRTAIFAAADALGGRDRLAGQPERAARTVADVEFLTVELREGQRYREFSPVISVQFVTGRDELRGLLGIAPAVTPQAVIDAMSAAARALAAGDGVGAERALGGPGFTLGGAGTLARLRALPPTPRAAEAAQAAAFELQRGEQRRGFGRL